VVMSEMVGRIVLPLIVVSFFAISCRIGGTLRSTDQASFLCVFIQDHADRL
jgi:hypothetical protein